MAISGFSKVSVDLEDDEDVRKAAFAKAQSLFNKALQNYRQQGSAAEVLNLFEDVEAALSDYLQTGFTGLVEKELELVLKGRLHQAVIFASLEARTDRWSRVKALTEDVLQFDYTNCHARWLRGQALLHGFKKRKEASEEMQRAVDNARQQGKTAEVTQWSGEMVALFDASSAVPSTSSSTSSPSKADQPSEASSTVSPAEATTAQPSSSSSAAGLQKGFFDRPKKTAKAAAAKPAASEPSSSSSAPPPKVKDDAELKVMAAELAEAKAAAAELAEIKRTLAEATAAHDEEVSRLQAELEEVRGESEDADRRQGEWQKNLLGELEAITLSLDDMLEPKHSSSAGRHNISEALDELKNVASSLTERLQSDKAWAEGEHRALLDCSTEVLTLREMTSRELKERQDASKQQVAELNKLTKLIGDVKPSIKVLRERAKEQLVAAGKEDEEPDLQRIVKKAMDFQALPTSTKLGAFLDDAAFMRLMLGAALLGMLLMLGIFIEVFGRYQCRFVCSR